MRISAVLCLLAACVYSAFAQSSLEVGAGAPNEYIRNQFVNAFSRGAFARYAELPPAGAVRRYGSTGLIQEFNDSSRAGARLALIKATSIADPQNPAGDVYQVLTDVFAYYGSVGVGTAGYPIGDTQFCPASACTYNLFSLNYALFAWSTGANEPQNISVRDPFYSRWSSLGGTGTAGPPVTAEVTGPSSFGGSATMQSFRNAVLFNITAGALSGRLVSVREPIHALYVARGAQGGSLGFPATEEQTLSNGRKRQTFEGGSIEYDQNSAPVVRAPVGSVQLRPGTTPVRLNPGESVTLQAIAIGTDGVEMTDRQITFASTNTRAVSIQATGATASVRALGAGTARVTATSEGKTSLPVEIVVTAQCCGVGEGAPTAALQQAFQDAVLRNRLLIRTPGAERVRRVGSGYVQELQGAEPNAGVRYLLAGSDTSGQVWVVSGPLLERYLELGGPPSLLGFPLQDASSRGRQLFEGGALAGLPVRVVTGIILTRWAAGGYESGPAGLPAAEALVVNSFTGAAGISQEFAGGVIAGSGRAWFVSGAAASRYKEISGASGELGFPLAEEIVQGNTRRQEFEGGSLETADQVATAVIRERKPAVSAVPGAVLPGGRVRVVISGFRQNATLRVSVAGRAEFLAPAESGAFSWDVPVPAEASPGRVLIRAVDTISGAAAEGAYTVRTLADARVVMSKIAGDTQTGAPGAMLPVPLKVALRDVDGNPVSGITIRFTASPGASVVPDTAVTDSDGSAQTRLRLPDTAGVALVTAEGARQAVTFSARSTGATSASFPRLMQSGSEPLGNGTATVVQAGALLASVASILRYEQTRGELPSPNGIADVNLLNDYLRRMCLTDSAGMQVCDGFLQPPGTAEQIVNLTRIRNFVDGNLHISVESADLSNVRALVSSGSPVLLSLALNVGGRAHYVVAFGTGADGALQIHDPDPTYGRALLADYTTGFDSGGQVVRGTITGALRLLPRPPSPEAFAVTSFGTTFRVSSAAGPCGAPLVLRSSSGAASVTQVLCSGDQPEYQLEFDGSGAGAAMLTDLADGGSRVDIAGSGFAAFRITRPGTHLVIAPQRAAIRTNGVVNAATLTPSIARGGLITIIGSGLAKAGVDTRIEIGGRPAMVVSATPFQVGAQIPLETVPGTYVLRLESSYGSAQASIEVKASAPAVFRVSGNGSQGLVTNADGSLNAEGRPATRGEAVTIWATGLGTLSGDTVTVVIRNQELRANYAGAVPGFPGLYQVNLTIPAAFPPGLMSPLKLRQSRTESEAVEISIY